MKDRNAIPLKRTGCLALSRVHGGGPGGGPAMPRSCAAVRRKGTKPLPHPLPAVGGRGGRLWFTGARGKSVLSWVSGSFPWQACFGLPSLPGLRGRKEVGKFAVLSVEVLTLSRACVRFWEGNLV